MPDPSAANVPPASTRPSRTKDRWFLSPVVLATIISLVIGIGYQIWQSAQPHYPLDLNSTTEKHLLTLPGIDEPTAQKIIGGRPYKRKDELVHRKILTEAQYEPIKQQIIARQK
ncbi:MAG TPA: hypothetical protein VIU63_09215 [Nitrospira sp.]